MDSSWRGRPSGPAVAIQAFLGIFSKVLDRHALSRGLAMTSLEKTSKFQDALKVFEIGIRGKIYGY